jgi:hypothetical protein
MVTHQDYHLGPPEKGTARDAWVKRCAHQHACEDDDNAHDQFEYPAAQYDLRAKSPGNGRGLAHTDVFSLRPADVSVPILVRFAVKLKVKLDLILVNRRGEALVDQILCHLLPVAALQLGDVRHLAQEVGHGRRTTGACVAVALRCHGLPRVTGVS